MTQLHTLSGSLQVHSPLWRALRRSRKRLRTVADGCEHCGATDHSLRHILCRHQYNCDTTDHSHRHLLCKHQYKCGDTAATQITLTDTSAANTNINAATRVNLTRFRDHSRCTRHCGEPYGPHANGCGRSRTVANIDTTFREHSLTPRPPNETGTLATHSGKKNTWYTGGSLAYFRKYQFMFFFKWLFVCVLWENRPSNLGISWPVASPDATSCEAFPCCALYQRNLAEVEAITHPKVQMAVVYPFVVFLSDGLEQIETICEPL